MEETIKELQKKFFYEYRDQCLRNPNLIEKDLNKWKSVNSEIRKMAIDEQSEFADYVVQKMCQQNEEIFEVYAKGTFNEIREIKTLENVQSVTIGNIALIIQTLPEGDFKDEFKHKFLELLN